MGLFSRGLSRNTKWEFSPKGRVFTHPAVADVNGDGMLEVVIGSDDHSVYALRGSDGGVVWTFETDGPVRSSPALGDINDDGVVEVVVGSDDSNVYALNGVDGRVLWALRCDGPVRSPPAFGDVDCDGKLEVIISGDDSGLYGIDGSSGELLWQSSYRGARNGAMVHSAPCLVDLDGDGQLEIATGSASNSVLIFTPSGSLRVRREFEAPTFNCSVAAGDVDGDGQIEIVTCSDNGALYVVRPDGEAIWSKVMGVGMRSSPVLSDINGDGKLEMLIHAACGVGREGRLTCLSCDGDVLWEHALRGQSGSTAVPVDIDHDGSVEVVVFSEKDGISILSGDGQEKKTIGVPEDSSAGLLVADVDGDGEFEFVYAAFGGRVVCAASHYGSRQFQVCGGSARFDRHNSGVYRTTPQQIEALKSKARELKEMGGSPGLFHQNLLKAEREQGMRDVSGDLLRVELGLSCARSQVTRGSRRAETLSRIKSRMKVFTGLDVDGATQLSLMVGRIERLLSQGKEITDELARAEELVDILEEKSKVKVQEINAKRLSFLVGQFLEKFPDPTDHDIEGFIKVLESENLPFLPYEIKKAIETRTHERKFQSLRDSGRFDFMSEEEKAIAIGSGLAESIIRDLMGMIGAPVQSIQERMDEVSDDFSNVPRLVVSDEGKILTDELRKTLKDMPPRKVISAAVSLFCLYITKLFDYYQELTDFETSYSRFKAKIDYLNTSFGAEDIVSQFQEKACHGIFAEEVRVKRILEL